MAVVPTLPKCPSSQPPSLTFFSSTPSFRISLVKLKPPPQPPASFLCCATQSEVAVVNGRAEGRISERNEIRLGLPSKGRMAADTLDLLKVNPKKKKKKSCLVPENPREKFWSNRNGEICRKFIYLFFKFLSFSRLKERKKPLHVWFPRNPRENSNPSRIGEIWQKFLAFWFSFSLNVAWIRTVNCRWSKSILDSTLQKSPRFPPAIYIYMNILCGLWSYKDNRA